jgi:putative tricarboxylic transport membrane protein
MMDFFQMLSAVIAMLLSPLSVAAFVLATLAGLALAALPGISPVAAVAAMLPLLAFMPPPAGTICLLAVIVAMQYGRAAVARPRPDGDPATDHDAFRPLPIATAALIGGVLVAIVAVALWPMKISILLFFGPAEYGALIICLLMSAVGFAAGPIVKGVAAAVVGLLLGLIGTDVETGAPRFTFGLEELQDGIGLFPLLIGIFVIADIIRRFEPKRPPSAPVGAVAAPPPIPAAILLGAAAGVVAASDRSLTTAADDRVTQPGLLEPVGQPSANLVARAAAAANARLSAGFFPLLALGLPPNALAVAVTGVVALQGALSPGSTMAARQQALYYVIFTTIIVANVVAFLAMVTVGRFMRFLGRVDFRIVAAVLLMLSCYSVYIVNNSAFDVGLMIAFGILGYLLLKLDCERTLLLIAFVVSHSLEEQIRRALLITRGSLAFVVQRPITATLLVLGIALLIAGRLVQRRWALR